MSRLIDILRTTTLWALFLLTLPSFASAQLTSQGQENDQVSYTAPNAVLAINTPAQNFSLGTGTNTFVFSVNPTVSAKVAITNETVNACLGAFSVAMAVSSDSGVPSFQNSLQSWQSVALISSSGQLALSTSIDIPALGTVYVVSTAISAPRLAVQVVNLTGGCATTNISVRVTTTSVAVTSPLVSVTGNGVSGGSQSNVQGIIPSGQNGVPIFPVIGGSLQPSINASFTQFGVDTFSGQIGAIGAGQTGTFTVGTPPTPSSATNWALVFWSGFQSVGAGSLGAPWSCVLSISNCGGSSVLAAAQLSNISNTNKVVETFNNSIAENTVTDFIVFNKTPTLRNGTQTNGNTLIVGSNTLAGSTLILALACASSPCSPTAVTDTQGNVWKQIVNTANGSGTFFGQNIWIAGPSTAAAETITITPNGATISASDFLELTGTIPGSVNQPSTPLLSDANKLLATGGNLPGVTDPCQSPGALKQSKPINIASATTTQLVALVAGQSVYVCGGGVTMVGAAQTLTMEYGTGASCGTGTTLLTGAMADGSVSDIWLPIGGGSATSFSTASGNALCAVTTGTVGQQGYLTYVQQ